MPFSIISLEKIWCHSLIAAAECCFCCYMVVLYELCFPLICNSDVTAAAGLLLENMSREELESTKDVMRSVLGGVSCRISNLFGLFLELNS